MVLLALLPPNSTKVDVLAQITYKGAPMIWDLPKEQQRVVNNLRRCPYCRHTGILDYIYGLWFQCRDCRRWFKLQRSH